jgi:hypothetical protein
LRLARALAIYARRDAAAAQRAAAALDVLAGGASPRDWCESPLTADRYPIELTCGPDASAIRYTVQVPAAAADVRLAESQRRLARLGAPSLSPLLGPRVDALLRSGPLAYGAWVGGRHDRVTDRFKLYIEAPHGDSPAARRFACEYLGANGPHIRAPLRMVGVDLADGTLEFYFRSGESWPSDLPLARRSAPDRDPLALLTASQAAGPCGFSMAIAREGHLVAVSLFAFASHLFGGDAHVRRCVLAFARRSGLAMRQYAALTRPLARSVTARDYHGLVSIVATGGARTSLRLGVSPPAAIVI